MTKRKRGGFEETIDSAAEYDTSTITNGDIEISEEDPEGRFIRLHNKSVNVRNEGNKLGYNRLYADAEILNSKAVFLIL